MTAVDKGPAVEQIRGLSGCCLATGSNGLLRFGTDPGFSGVGQCLPAENSQRI